MFYSLFFLLFPIFQNKMCLFHNKKTELNNDLDYANLIGDENSNNNNNEKLVFVKQNYTGFDLTKNNSFVDNDNNELQKITNYFRKIKQLRFLESPFVSNCMKLKRAEEILQDLEDTMIIHDKKNTFWETFEDIFF